MLVMSIESLDSMYEGAPLVFGSSDVTATS